MGEHVCRQTPVQRPTLMDCESSHRMQVNCKPHHSTHLSRTNEKEILQETCLLSNHGLQSRPSPMELDVIRCNWMEFDGIGLLPSRRRPKMLSKW